MLRKKYKINYYNDVTNLPNRRNPYLYLRNRKEFSVLLIDLGRLKGVNETYGFIYGDMLLNFAAKEIVRIVGTKGRAFHFQGEEFAVFLREQDPKKLSNGLKV
ncbi:MAG TPA: hypothetical protein DEA47_01175 [Peptococcaceae bacterium]|nr:MAG: diguanylate cyclase/phosphodiesterase [Clostridia bacterium 41_269]HBT19973.1 hypothetical protein [Peptococcaceae bacterium]